MNREQFFKYHSNAGGKLLTCFINQEVYNTKPKLYNINKREFNKLPRGTKLELPCGTLYTIDN